MGDDAAQRVLQRVGQAAGLRAFAAVGAAPGVGMADVALAREGDAQRAMDEEFEHRRRAVRRIASADFQADCLDLRQREFARQYQLRKADIGKKLCLLRPADVALRRGMQLDRRQVEFEQAHVLQDQRIDAGIVGLPGDAPRLLEFVVAKNGV